MSEYESVEQYANHVRKVTSKTLGALCVRLGPEHPATVAIEALCTEAANIVQQSRMRQEQAVGYDLAALSVNPSAPSNSETGWERED